MNWIAAGEGMGFVAESFQYPQVGAGRAVRDHNASGCIAACGVATYTVMSR